MDVCSFSADTQTNKFNSKTNVQMIYKKRAQLFYPNFETLKRAP